MHEALLDAAARGGGTARTDMSMGMTARSGMTLANTARSIGGGGSARSQAGGVGPGCRAASRPATGRSELARSGVLTNEAVRAAQQAVAATMRSEAGAGNHGPTTAASRRGAPLTRLRGGKRAGAGGGAKAAAPQDVGRDAAEVAAAVEMLDGLIFGLLDAAGKCCHSCEQV
jgi:hypothetical protein